jgi:hypothetical protein
MYSVAMTADVDRALRSQLTREDGDEDVCIATYTPSTGAARTTMLLTRVILPQAGDREVHGNASFHGQYIVRAAAEAARRGAGIALLHSHPGSRGWQGLSGPDFETESEYSRVAEAVTSRPLLGLTLAGADRTWSARVWTDASRPEWTASVRVVGDKLDVSWNSNLRPAPRPTASQVRTISAWGDRRQADIARLRVLVVGVGSVGLDIVQRLAASGIEHIGVMDFDAVELLNLDRMIGATPADARAGVAKTAVAERLARLAATASSFRCDRHELSIADPDGVAVALDYDVIFCCVDRPWPRAVLNGIAYADLIPVIDGGLSIDTFPTGEMRASSWRVQALVPGNPCMLCSGQIGMTEIRLDMSGLLDDEAYIRGAGGAARLGAQNVATLAGSVSAAQLGQFVSLTAAPAGIGVAGPLRYIFAIHHLEHLSARSGKYCPYEGDLAVGDLRATIAEPRAQWRHIVAARNAGKERGQILGLVGPRIGRTWSHIQGIFRSS